MNQVCQLYTYNATSLELIRENESYFTRTFKVGELDKKNTYWLNYHSLASKEEISCLMEEQGLHRLTIEDVFTEKHRPKLEEFDNYIFFTIQSALPSGLHEWSLVQEQISFVLGKNYLISLQEKKSDHFPEVRKRLESDIGMIRQRGADFLLFKMLDAIVDNYFEVLDHITELIRTLEIKVFKDTSEDTLKEVEVLKKQLTELRRIVVPLRDIAMQLEKSENSFIASDNLHYFNDLKDNCLSIIDEIDTNKNVLDSLTNLYYASQGQKMNEIMKLLTIVSTIFIPLTFIAGVYGMNFVHMPELKLKYGYYIIWGVMIIISVALWFYFKSKGWLRRDK